ncbi:MAG: hypothetical protein AB7H66_02915 [Hyphomonadaceae bacterium]
MTLLDFAKALGVALLLMALNVAAAFGVVWVYASFIEPEHEQAFYVAAAQEIAPWSSIFAGAALFFLAMLWLAWRRQGRNGFLFAGVGAGIYAAIDIAVIAAEGALAALGAMVAASMLSKLAAALLGAWLARPR